MTTNEESLAYPGIYPDENDIIPYSPRAKFGFTYPVPISETTNNIENTATAVIKLESMKDMSINDIVELYRNGYRIEDTYPTTSSTIMTTQGGVSISTGALLLIIGSIGLIWYLRSTGKI